jgi:hypothetical protein
VTELTRPEHFSTLFALVEAQSADAASSSSSGSSGGSGFNSVSVSNMAWDLLMRMPTNAAVLSKLLMVSIAFHCSTELQYTTATDSICMFITLSEFQLSQCGGSMCASAVRASTCMLGVSIAHHSVLNLVSI